MANSKATDNFSFKNPKLINNVLKHAGVNENDSDRVYDFVDFFSGCGGMSYGFHALEKAIGAYKYIGAFDIDPYANKTYAKNYGVEPHNEDIALKSADDIKDIISNLRSGRNNPLVVIGCAPCQGFSSHKKKDPRPDPRNTLIGKFAEIVTALEPEIVIMENVPDLLAKKHWSHYEAFCSTLESKGYNITSTIINMAEYGVPQERHRTLVLASKNHVPTIPKQAFNVNSYRTVRDAIGDLPKLEAGQICANDPMHVTSKHRKETIEIIKSVPLDGGSRPPGIGPKCLDKVAGFYDVYGRLPWDRPAITITARCRTPSCGRFAHPEQHRGLSVREAALLQGFPPDFVFEGPFDDKFKQIGNAVPPLFSLQLAAHVLTILTGENSNETPNRITKPFFKSYSSIIAKSKEFEKNSIDPKGMLTI